MQVHPQIKASTEAARSPRAERYWCYGSTDERVEFLRALGDVLTEVSYHLDASGAASGRPGGVADHGGSSDPEPTTAAVGWVCSYFLP
jgi:hypothetical protein